MSSSIYNIPSRISGLNDLASNLWWSWHPEGRQLFKTLDRALWKNSGHNPVKMLQQIPAYRLTAQSEDSRFLKKYDYVISNYKRSLSDQYSLCSTDYPSLKNQTIAYFSMEFAIHSSIPIYAGGLGVLAGDYCKEASDIGLDLVGIGFMYPQGYFIQRLSADGWQEEVYRNLNFNEAPIRPILDDHQKPLKIRIDLDSKSVQVSVWQVEVGRVTLYLLDTNLEENCPEDRQLTDRLYGGNVEKRLQQEIILGIGGVRVLRALGINPSVWHANEGHSAFMLLERCRELVTTGMDFDEAFDRVQPSSVFTTHTPVPAGNDSFDYGLMDKYFVRYWDRLGLTRQDFLELGSVNPGDNHFNMTALALKMAGRCNGVSRLHGAVCRQMWHSLWPELNEKEVPIGSITNGVHVPTWIAPQMADLYEKYVGPDWRLKVDDHSIWSRVEGIPDEEMMRARRWLKGKLLNFIKDKARECWRREGGSPSQTLATGCLLDVDTLTLGYSRRFTDYKRAWLIFSDIKRLKRILNNDLHPVQIIFAGKAHANDHQGKMLIQQVHNLARDPQFAGRIAFVEDYDMHTASYLVQGVDIWLNTPRPLQEASGTSGMKAALNGVPHLSILDGWWSEGYNGSNGWAITPDPLVLETGDQDKAEAETLYKLLEEKIVPLYYDRNYYGIPHNWVKLMKQTIRSNIGMFSTRRMIKEYIEQMYLPATLHTSEQNSPEVHGSAGNYLRWLPNRDNPELSRKQ